MRYGIEVTGPHATYLVHRVDGLVKAFDQESDAAALANYLSAMQLIEGAWRTVKVTGRAEHEELRRA